MFLSQMPFYTSYKAITVTELYLEFSHNIIEKFLAKKSIETRIEYYKRISK